MQKDDDDILEDWIRYHANLFGLENLYIVDNMSGEISKHILCQYAALGLHVCEQTDYSKKASICMN
jgi:hypothetical protein